MRFTLKTKLGIISFILGVFVFTGFLISFQSIKELIDKREEDYVRSILTSIDSQIGSNLDSFKNELFTLSKLSSIQELIVAKKDSPQYREILRQVNNIFYTFVEGNGDYFQIGYIDKDGMEVARVDRLAKKAQVKILGGPELPSKKDRYYFTEAMNLAKGELYVSELDLNVEDGEIQVPYVPTIRLATPVYSPEGVEGVIVMNIFGDNLINIIKLSPYLDTSLLDQDGYYLYHAMDVNKEWGKYLGNSEVFPDFKDQAAVMQGIMRADNFVVKETRMNGSESGKHFFYKIRYTTTNPDKFWIIALNINDKEFFKDYYDFRRIFTLENALLIIIAVLVFVISMMIILRPLRYINNSIQSLNKGDYNTTIPVISNDELGEFSKKFNALIKNIRQRNKEKYEFIASASHQLRTPASIVRANLGVLKEKLEKRSTNKKYLDILGDIIIGNKTVIKILNDMLKYLEIGEDYFATNTKRINIKVMIERIIEAYNEKIKAQNLNVKINMPDNLRVKAEESRIKDVLLNLIENAIEYSNNNGKISIVAKKIEKHKILFEIKDNGIGIPSDEHFKVFDKFFRARNVFSKKVVGSGLGLIIAKKIIEGHGGTIWFESEEGKGANFYFTIFN